MSEEEKKRLVEAVIIKLLEIASKGGFRLMWADFTTGRVMFKMDPTNEQVSEILKAVPQAGAS